MVWFCSSESLAVECVEGTIDDSCSNDVALTGSGGLSMKGCASLTLLLEGGPQDGQGLGRLRRGIAQSGDGVVGIVLGQQLGGVLLLLLLLG